MLVKMLASMHNPLVMVTIPIRDMETSCGKKVLMGAIGVGVSWWWS
jgi:hypothetical protein